MKREELISGRHWELSEILREELEQQLNPEGLPTPEPAGAAPLPEVERERQREVIARIHREVPQRSALCLSGGGIRSASFSLGVLQELARAGILKQFDYLSTVSGGGYIGGWLSAWIAHRQGAIGEVESELSAPPAAPLMPEPEPIRHLRAFSNYLAPRYGLFSPDTWALIATVVRNLLLNWLVLLPIFTAALVLPCFGPWAVTAQPTPATLRALLIGGFALLTIALVYPPLDLPSLANLRWNQRRFLIGFLLPLAGGLILLAVWWAGYRNTSPYLWAGFAGNVPATIAAPDLWFEKGLWRGGPLKAILWMITSCLAGSSIGWIVSVWRAQARGEHLKMIGRTFGVALVSIFVGALGGLVIAAMAHAFHDPARAARSYVLFAPPVGLAFFFLLVAVFIGLSSFHLGDEDREWWGRAMGWIGIAIVGWMVPHGLMLFATGAFATHGGRWWSQLYTAAGGAMGLGAALYGFSHSTEAKRENAGRNPLGALLPVVGAVGFFLLLGCGVSWLVRVTVFEKAEQRSEVTWAEQNATANRTGAAEATPAAPDVLGLLYDEVNRDQFLRALAIPLLAILFAASMGFWINVNKFSLHMMYRNRLIRAFLGASRTTVRRRGDTDPARAPHPFTGFDPADNVQLAALAKGKLFHVVNIALNVVRGGELAWQERKAQSFTATPLHCGSWRLGYRSSEDYGGGVSLGTVLAISGAAANPNAGYHSSPVVTFLMTLFNLRLGWWLGNPRVEGRFYRFTRAFRSRSAGANRSVGGLGRPIWKQPGPQHAAWPLLAEALGDTREQSAYVNLSDGGHFENLGIYEMVLRRCHSILAIDGGCDTEYSFEDLGNMIRKVRIDLGVEITIKLSRMIPVREEGRRFSESAEGPLLYCACGTIEYSKVEPGAPDGELIYLKPMMTGEAPADVANYHTGHPEFPHEPTSDQFFSESQLESYRALGAHQLRTLCRQDWCAGSSLSDFFKRAREHALAS